VATAPPPPLFPSRIPAASSPPKFFRPAIQNPSKSVALPRLPFPETSSHSRSCHNAKIVSTRKFRFGYEVTHFTRFVPVSWSLCIVPFLVQCSLCLERSFISKFSALHIRSAGHAHHEGLDWRQRFKIRS
jgi:hypothetical protein